MQGLLDWFEVDLGFTELSFIQIDLCVLCDNKEGTYLIYIQDITHSYMRHDSFMFVTRLIHTYELVVSRIWEACVAVVSQWCCSGVILCLKRDPHAPD